MRRTQNKHTMRYVHGPSVLNGIACGRKTHTCIVESCSSKYQLTPAILHCRQQSEWGFLNLNVKWAKDKMAWQ